MGERTTFLNSITTDLLMSSTSKIALPSTLLKIIQQPPYPLQTETPPHS